MSKRNWFEDLIAGFAHAVGDIRQKVLEEGWFGHSVTQPLHTTELGWIRPEERAEKSAVDHVVGWLKSSQEPAEKETAFTEREARGWHRPASEMSHDRDRDHEQGLDR